MANYFTKSVAKAFDRGKEEKPPMAVAAIIDARTGHMLRVVIGPFVNMHHHVNEGERIIFVPDMTMDHDPQRHEWKGIADRVHQAVITERLAQQMRRR